ncbi:MAG: NUDIX domain-containing protein [Bacteroidia bacterium]|jgi:8-oxo-dGTP diphosphatase|nr:NUDIX domain-containing protein [Bacteroidia bacterium]
MKEKYVDQANPNVSVDCVVFGFDGSDLKVLLVQRDLRDNLDIDDDTLVLPGDLINDDEDLDEAASRILKGLTGIKNIFLEQIGAFGSPKRLLKKRDQVWLNAIRVLPNARVITVGYFALVNIKNYKTKPAGFAKHVLWQDYNTVEELGFDHNVILNSAISVLRDKLYREPVGFQLLGKEFSLHQLYTLYNEIMGGDIDRRNFRRKMLKTGFLKETENYQEGVPHKPARLYTFAKKKFDNVSKANFKFY